MCGSRCHKALAVCSVGASRHLEAKLKRDNAHKRPVLPQKARTRLRGGRAKGSTISPCRAGISASALRGDAQVDPSRTHVWIIEAPAGNEETRVNARVRRPAPDVGGPVPSIRMRKGRFPLTHAAQRAWNALVRSACIRRPETCRKHSHSVQAEPSASGGATPLTWAIMSVGAGAQAERLELNRGQCAADCGQPSLH